MNNKVYYQNREKFMMNTYDKLKQRENIFIQQIDGSEIYTWNDFAKTVIEQFEFPYPDEKLNMQKNYLGPPYKIIKLVLHGMTKVLL